MNIFLLFLNSFYSKEKKYSCQVRKKWLPNIFYFFRGRVLERINGDGRMEFKNIGREFTPLGTHSLGSHAASNSLSRAHIHLWQYPPPPFLARSSNPPPFGVYTHGREDWARVTPPVNHPRGNLRCDTTGVVIFLSHAEARSSTNRRAMHRNFFPHERAAAGTKHRFESLIVQR